MSQNPFNLDVPERISDPVDSGVAQLREQQAVSRLPDDYEGLTAGLEDLDGVGPATADKLRDAGIDKPEELARVTPSQLEAVDGIGPSRADKISRDFQYGTDYRFQNPKIPERVEKAQADRSSEARRTDRSFNAKTTLDADEWLENPADVDYPGVDTIPESRRTERASRAAKRNPAAASVEGRSLPGKTQGSAAGGRIEVDPSGAAVSTLAHEVGHTVEGSEERGFAAEKIFDDSEDLRNEAAKLSKRRRFSVGSDPSEVREAFIQDEDSELIADAVGVAIEEPRAARREAPNVISKIEREFSGILPGKRS
jgi:hypothetical protein